MPTKKTAKSTHKRTKRGQPLEPIPDPTPEQIKFIADVDRRYTEALQQQVCDVCEGAWHIPKKESTSPNGRRWQICVVCSAALRDLDRPTMKAVMLKRTDKMDWLMMRLPYLREYLDDKTSFDEIDRKVA